MNQSTVKKILCTTLILSFTTQASFAVQNYIHTTTTNETYSASSPIGRFENYSSNGTVLPTTAVSTAALPAAIVPVDYNYYPANYTVAAPVYTAGAVCTNTDLSQTASIQDIQAPQEYNKTVTTTDQYVDTRETADKVIDRGVKIVGTLAVVGAVAGLILGACK